MHIDACLGSDARACLVLALLALTPFFFRQPGKGKRECILLCGGILLLALNPWCAGAIAAHTNKVMSWRWLWVAPIAVVLTILLAVFWSRSGTPGVAVRRCGSVAGGVFMLAFLSAGAWTCRAGNRDCHFARPQWKVPREYAEVAELAALLPSTNEGLHVLAPRRQAAWLPVIRPGLPLVMGGHTQNGTYRKLVGRRKHADRLAAQSLLERWPNALTPDQVENVLDTLRVTHIMAPRYKMEHKQFVSLQRNGNTRIVGETEHFSVLRLR